MAANAPHLPGTIAMGVGAAFDVHTGRVARAPRPVRAAGLEWAYRIACEPARLWRRYAEVVPRFLWLVAREEIKAGFRARAPLSARRSGPRRGAIDQVGDSGGSAVAAAALQSVRLQELTSRR